VLAACAMSSQHGAEPAEFVAKKVFDQRAGFAHA
jgi:hypothetical protein